MPYNAAILRWAEIGFVSCLSQICHRFVHSWFVQLVGCISRWLGTAQIKMAFWLGQNAILVTDCIVRAAMSPRIATVFYAPALAVLASDAVRGASTASRKYNR